MESALPASAPEDLKRTQRQEQVRLLFETQFFNIGATLTITALVAFALFPTSQTEQLLLWCAAMVICNLGRALIALRWRRDKAWLQRIQMWWWLLVLSGFLGGSGWGIGSYLLFPGQSPARQMLLVFVTCGISAAAAVSLAVDRYVAWGFLIPCILPLEYQFFIYSKALGPSMAVMGFVYMAYMAGVVNRLHHHMRDNVALRLAETELQQRQNDFAQALHSSQEKLQALFELSPLGCILMRMDGTLVEANQSSRRILGFESPEEFEQAFNAALNSPQYAEEDRERWRQLIAKGGTDAFECQMVRKDGSPILVSLHRMVIDTGDGQHYVWALMEDVTERHQHEEQLLALNNRLSLATQAGGIGVWELDLTTREVLWDARMYEIYGISPALKPLLSEVPAALVHPDDGDRVEECFMAAVTDPEQERYLSEFRIILADNTERCIRTAGIFRRDEDGLAQRIIGVAWDITDIKRVERMKSEFVSTVSHELRTPLTSIRGSLGLAASGALGELPAAARELIDIAYKNSERLSLLINDILDIEKIESGKMRLDLQHHALQPLIEQVVEANRGFAQNFSVQLLLQANTNATVIVDAHRFMQVMANLISNAVKFSKVNDNVEITIIDMPSRVRIEVRDRGPGIPTDFRERIFQRFSQADSSDTRARGGSGLGLAITKSLVEKMYGDIGFMERAGGGTVFFVELPSQ